MIRSMTAFARSERTEQWGTAYWELRSVNNRYLDVTPRLPEEVRAIEASVRERVRAKLGRGKVDCSLRLSLGTASDASPGAQCGPRQARGRRNAGNRRPAP